MLWLVVAVAAQAGSLPALDEAIALRDQFEHERAIAVLGKALDGDDVPTADAAVLRWHLGVVLYEARRVEDARAQFALAAASLHAPRLRVDVSPAIQEDIDVALARARAAEASPPADRAAQLGDGSAPPTPTGTDDDAAEVPILSLASAGVGGAGLIAAGVGAVIWGLGLVEHQRALDAQSQPERDERNVASAPLQLAGQVVVGVGVAVALAGGAGALLLWPFAAE